MIRTSTTSTSLNKAGQDTVKGIVLPKWASKLPLHIVLIILLVVMLTPFFWMLGMSLKPDAEATPNALDGVGRDPGVFLSFFVPQGGFQFENYVKAWIGQTGNIPVNHSFLDAPFTQFYFNSMVSGLLQVFGVLVTSTLAAYAFARMEFFGKNILFLFVLATMTIPGEATYLPNLVIVSNLKLTNTLGALFVPWLSSAFSIFLLRQFFMSIPIELYEAGQIDGLSEIGYLWRVALPLSSAAVLTSALFTFMGSWNSLLWPLIASPKTPTVQLGLQTFMSNGDTQTQWNVLMAASTIAILPIVIIYFFVQKRFIEGIARSGIK